MNIDMKNNGLDSIKYIEKHTEKHAEKDNIK